MDDRKKILFFIESLHCGGAEKSLLSLLHSLDYDRVEVDLLMLSDKGAFVHMLPPDVNVRLLPDLPGWGSLMQRCGHLAFSTTFRAHGLLGIKRHKAETLWSTEGRLYPALHTHYDVAIAYQQGLPTYYVAEKVDADIKLAWANVDLKGAGYRPMFNAPCYRKFDGVVAVSRVLAESVVADGFTSADKLSVIYDILSVPLIRKLSEDTPDALPEHVAGEVRLVTVGRMSLQKNYPLAVDTAKVLRDRGLRFKWIFVGAGTELEKVRSRIAQYGLSDMVIPVGLKTNPYPYMADADIYVHTAAFEGFGLTIAEAKILGKPVVSTNFSVVYDQITDGVNGLVAEMSPESLADKIMLMASDKTLRDSVTANIAKERNTTELTEVEKFYRLIGLNPDKQ